MAYISFQPKDYFNTKLYTGTGSAASITGVGFQPDWVWVKDRGAANSNNLSDAVRGVTKTLFSDATAAEVTDAQRLTSFNSDGFSVGTSTSWNASSNTYASWNWKANGQGSSNTDGTINTTYTSVNTTSGFSICQYTGTGANATVGHGLGVAPKMVIVKRTNTTGGWTVYHSSVGNTKYLYLNTTAAEDTASSIWNNTSPTSSVFTVGTDGEVNASGSTYIAYCFAEKRGFSSMGSYVGNGSADGTFVYTGFKPAWVMVKRTNTAEGWYIIDNKRTGFNEANYALIAQATSAEETGTNRINLLSNGFKATTSNTAVNGSGDNYIYIAFADSPLVSSNGVPAVAR